jgi:hypothetical protein
MTSAVVGIGPLLHTETDCSVAARFFLHLFIQHLSCKLQYTLGRCMSHAACVRNG